MAVVTLIFTDTGDTGELTMEIVNDTRVADGETLSPAQAMASSAMTHAMQLSEAHGTKPKLVEPDANITPQHKTDLMGQM